MWCRLNFSENTVHEDMTIMYNGVRIKTVHGERITNGAFVSICVDTLAQRKLLGFYEGVGFAFSKCQHCECHFDDMQVYFDEENFVKQTSDGHIQQCNEIERATIDLEV